MESLSKRLNAVQDDLLNLYEEGSDQLQRQVEHWNLTRQENVLLHYARQSGVMRVGMQPVPPLQVSAERAKSAIEMQLMLQSLCDSPWATETWTLSDTCRERWLADPPRCWKKGPCTVEVVYDGDADNSMHYTLWQRIYYQDSSDRWQMSKSQVDHSGIWFWDCEHKHYYVKFATDAERYSATGVWEVVYNNETISSCDPVTSTTPPTDPCGEAELYPHRIPTTQRRAGDGGEEPSKGEAPAAQGETELPAIHTPTHTSPFPDSTSNSPEPVSQSAGGVQRPSVEPVGTSPQSTPPCTGSQQGPNAPETPRKPKKRQPTSATAGPGSKRKPADSQSAKGGAQEPSDEPLLVPVYGERGGGGDGPVGCEGGGQQHARALAVPSADPGPLGPPSPSRGSASPSPPPPPAAAARRPPPRAPAARQGRVPVEGGHRDGPEHLFREAGDSPASALVLCGPANTLKCFRYRLCHNHSHRYSHCSTTWYWTGQGAGRLGPARIIVTFRDRHQKSDFLAAVRLPPSVTAARSLLAI
ncbi:E2 [Canis familiaris papillomavirus 8]|uniref:Regulatory protein E2 n=2 Tax=Canis familiaris papillomavirus 8 TaxID=1081055 RepID=G3DRE0_9PAPI|nr:E2 [Canis familiaris papillomavirus 8]AEO16193.1 E2 [Canis familiaris papillomavirus 8]